MSRNKFSQCRTCYNHLAGYVGVALAEAMEAKNILKKSENIYLITTEGWVWFSKFGISKNDFKNSRRPMTRQCIDGTERRPHLAGQIGDVLLEKMISKGWFDKVALKRELLITPNGLQSLKDYLGIDI